MSQAVSKKRPTNRGLARTPFSNLFSQSMFPSRLIDEMFDQFVNRGDGELAAIANVSMDVAETEQAFEVKVDLPGITPDEIDIQIDNNTLTIRGSREGQSEERDEGKQFHRLERYSGSFARSVVLPNSINEDETAAEFNDGVLCITIPKSDEAKPKKINISR
ncbi:MAG: Hsp20/alpha crystallin family protein [Planctomycetota bacterium]